MSLHYIFIRSFITASKNWLLFGSDAGAPCSIGLPVVLLKVILLLVFLLTEDSDNQVLTESLF